MKKRAKVKPGSYVEIKTKDEKFSGILIESYESGTLLLKLDSGYNIGIKENEIQNIKQLKKPSNKEVKIKLKQSKKLPNVSFIITGGTISSQVDHKTGGVKPLTKPEQLFALAPNLLKTININNIERPFSLLSENMTPREWQKLAGITSKLLNEKENKGIIITHGTDTLHYTSAALAFMLRNLNKPVCLTYSQRSIDRGSSDATLNLECSAHASLSDIAEVMLIGHASSSDNFCHAIRGTKARKMHTSRRDAFKSINDAPLAKINQDGKIQILNKNYNKRSTSNKQVNEDTAFESKTALIKFYPGASSEIIDWLIDKKYKGIVIEGTGFGHFSQEWIPSIKRALQEKVTVAVASQTIFGRTNHNVYSAGRELCNIGVIHCEDMLPEVAYIKLGWILGHTENEQEIKKLMTTNIAGEINRKLSDEDFLY
ncbi:MAG: Glu-tRNA(Gln) amidotransferase subunit GatD [Nanoarchaeota archaeon]|nr:Glu-tRNA(Gln) amidotransferase subunit GatD [Nanoarchaeota archaeon]